MKFSNRESAGLLLGKKLETALTGRSDTGSKSKIIVIGLPRGGVPVAFAVATQLECALDVIVAKKLPYPGQPEYAIGAVSSDGVVELDKSIPQNSEWQTYVDAQKQKLLIETRESESRFRQRAGIEKLSLKDNTVIIVDDGIATGMTVKAAIKSAILRGCKHLVVAAPAMSIESFIELKTLCDQVITLITPEPFGAVGHYYIDFDQTLDEEVIENLRENRSNFQSTYASPDSNNITRTVAN